VERSGSLGCSYLETTKAPALTATATAANSRRHSGRLLDIVLGSCTIVDIRTK